MLTLLRLFSVDTERKLDMQTAATRPAPDKKYLGFKNKEVF